VVTVGAGLVATEFSPVRLRGDTEQAKAVCERTRPLHADHVAGRVMFALTPPPRVVVDEPALTSVDQSSGARVHRR
jgi:NADP-dependent 3-hydroxy acid dehydrogenase YdfG